MAFLAPAAEDTPDVAELYAHDRATSGAVANHTRTFSLRPAVYAAWETLNSAVKDSADPRVYRVATIAAARRLRSSYCALAHGQRLAAEDSDATVRTLIGDESGWDRLSPVDAAVARLADTVVADAPGMSDADLDELRGLGFDDGQLLDVILTAAARCFFSTVLDATGTQPDHDIAAELPAEIRRALTVGRPISPD